MRLLGVLALASILPLSGFAASIQIFNTGVNSTGTATLAPGAIDPHYTDTVLTNQVQATTQNGAWVVPDAVAMYVSPSNATQGSGNYTLDYVTTINLTGFDPTSVNIQGKWSTDNSGNNISINGHGTGNTSPGFSGFTTFTLLGSSGFFTTGVNSIDFNWTNSGGPGGILVEFTSATANAVTGGVPEPGSLALLASGLLGFAWVSCRRRQQR